MNSESQIHYVITGADNVARGGPVPERIDSSLDARGLVRALRELNPGIEIGLKSVTVVTRTLVVHDFR